MADDPIYELYRKEPPPEDKRRSVTVISAYFDGFYGSRKRYVRGSTCWWAYKAGRDNAKQALEQFGGWTCGQPKMS